MATTNVTFQCGALTLEGRLSLPQGVGPFPGVVLCHPHPLYGGDLNNNVVQGIALALGERQIAALAFNFRGVGNSEGAHDQGIGEVADALAAVEHLANHSSVDRNRLGIAGYSFGAAIALDAAAREWDLRAVASVACPTPPLNDLAVHQINRPKLFIQGDMDHVAQLDLFRFLVRRFQPPGEVAVIPGADHFFHGYEPEVGSRVAEFFQRTLA